MSVAGGGKSPARVSIATGPSEKVVWSVEDDATDEAGRPVMSRGLSIKVSMPAQAEEEDEVDAYKGETPSFYHSTSLVSGSSIESNETERMIDTDIPIPSQSQRLHDITDITKNYIGAPLPLHRTESRLPSLEDMLQDETLRGTIVEDEHHPVMKKLVSALSNRDPLVKFKALQDFIKCQVKDISFEASKLPRRVMNSLPEVVVVFVRQQLAKTVELLRAIEDQQGPGRDDQVEVQDKLLNPPEECGVIPWALISLGLKILRNACSVKAIQETIQAHGLDQLLVCRHRLAYSIYAHAKALQRTKQVPSHLKPFVEEVSEVLPRSIFTFLSNLMTENDNVREALWKSMWPEAYWTFAVMSGTTFLDYFSLMLHNHLTPLLNGDLCFDESPHDSLKLLDDDIRELDKISNEPGEEWIRKLNSPLGDILALLLTYVHMKHRTPRARKEERKAREASYYGRAFQEQAASEDWFALLQLRLLSLGRGHALHVLISSLLDRQDANTAKTVQERGQCFKIPAASLEWMKESPWASPIFELADGAESIPTPCHLVSVIAYSLAEYAAVPHDELIQIQRTRTLEITPSSVEEGKSGKKLSRKWNLVRRSFLTEKTLGILMRLAEDGLCDAAKTFKLPTVMGILKKRSDGTRRATENQATILIRPIFKCLLPMLTAPELSGRISKDMLRLLWDINFGVLADFKRPFQAFLAENLKGKEAGPDFRCEYTDMLQVASPRDSLLVIGALSRLLDGGKSTCTQEQMDTVITFNAFQAFDIGCEQAAAVTIKHLLENPANRTLVDGTYPGKKTDA